MLFLGMENSLLLAEETKSGWHVEEKLSDVRPQSIAIDPLQRDRIYCATFGDGIWLGEDSGNTWTRTHFNSPNATSVAAAVSANRTVLYAGTEPSSVFRSDDGGLSWTDLNGMRELKSSDTWSFPPRPNTHHVRWIGPDANDSNHLYVAIEAGALVQSPDGGRSWIDRVKTGPYDTHTLATHPKAPGRVYSSAGDGYFESYDSGKSWKRLVSDLGHRYVYGLAVNPSDPDNVVISSASSAFEAHYPGGVESYIYAKSNYNSNWVKVSDSLMSPDGTFISILCASQAESELYALNNRGVFHSADFGEKWKKLDIPWKKEYLNEHPWCMAAN